MKMNAIVVMILTSYNWVFCHAGYFSTKYCTGYADELFYNIVCNDPDQFPNDLPTTTEYLTIICSKNATINGSILSNISHKDVSRYNMLKSFVIRACPIEDFPENLFTNFPYLQSVILDGLPIKRLRNIFRHTDYLIDLSLVSMFMLEHIDYHILDHQKIFSRIIFDNTSISADNLMHILKPVGKTLKEFRNINNRFERMVIPVEFFGDYQLGLLDLQNNYIRDWDFLNYTKSRKIILANTQSLKSHFDLSMYRFIHEFCESLDLENIGIGGRFPKTVTHKFVHTRSLSVKGNRIESLNDKVDEMFPHLKLLDISFNQIKSLQPALNDLFFKTQSFKLEGNPLHCNCQLRWLSARYKSKIADFPRCNFDYRTSNKSSKVKSNENIFFSQLATDSLICVPPRTPVLSIFRGQKPTKLIVSHKNALENVTIIKKEYTLIMESNQLVELMCETEGDPTPTLIWSNQTGPLLTRYPPSHMNYFSTNQITVGLGGSNVSSIYMCTASNIEGISYALLNLVPKMIDGLPYKISSNASYKRIISNLNEKNCATKTFAQFSEFKTDFIWKILYFVTSSIANKYFL